MFTTRSVSFRRIAPWSLMWNRKRVYEVKRIVYWCVGACDYSYLIVLTGGGPYMKEQVVMSYLMSENARRHKKCPWAKPNRWPPVRWPFTPPQWITILYSWPSGFKSLNLVFIVSLSVSSPSIFFRSYDSSSPRSIIFINKKAYTTRLIIWLIYRIR